MRVLGWLYLALAFGFIFLPVAVLVLFSFQEGRLPVPPFNGPSLRWYQDVLGDRRLMEGLRHSLIVASLSAALALLLGFMAAQALARHRLPGTLLMRAALIAPLTVSYLIIALGLLSLFNRAGIGLSLWTAGIGHVVINLPLCFAILYASMGEQQRSAETAARDLGAGEVRVLALITAPMLAPSMLAAYFLAFTFSWDEFIIAYLLTRFDVTLPVEIWSLLRSGLTPRANAIGSVVFLVSVGVLVALQLLVFRKVRP